MDFKEIEKLITLAKDNEVAELSYKSKEGVEVKVKTMLGVQVTAASPVEVNIPTPAVKDSVNTKSDPNLKEVLSPFVGTFYRSSSPDTASYAKEGQSVGSGQVLCIVEAMKIMNEIESDHSGEIVEICVENETYVEFGQVLFKIRV